MIPMERRDEVAKNTVLIADDHPLFRKGMCSLLESLPDFEVIGEAASGKVAIQQAADLQPDIILMDLQMPEGSGLEAIRTITSQSPNIRILVVTLFEDDDSVFAALRAGARGYLLKDAEEDEMVRAIRAVVNNEAIFSPAIANRVLRYFAGQPALPKTLFPGLTDRERDILKLLAQGDNNAKIAEKLMLSQKTVSNYVSNIFSKLQVTDRAQAIIKAREAGVE
jgi:DNA-binding NarL/FixJ family response regulator